jgi:hypothetical protein
MLAGLEGSANTFQADEYFVRAVRELGIREPGRDEAMYAYACDVAQMILEAKIDPVLGVRLLYRICVEAQYPAELMVWFQLDDALDDLQAGAYPWTYESATPENISEIIGLEARRFLELCRTAEQSRGADAQKGARGSR